MQRPTEFVKYLGPYEAVGYDAACGEPIAWGFSLRRRLDDAQWNALSEHGEMECFGNSWALVVKRLTHLEAIEKYGGVSECPTGPRGGWRSITYGKRQFLSKLEGVVYGHASRTHPKLSRELPARGAGSEAVEVDPEAFECAFGIPDPGPEFHDEIVDTLRLLLNG